MDIKAGLIDTYRIIVYDETRNSVSKLPSVVHSISLDVLSDIVSQDSARDLDVLGYMYSNRNESELYIIDSNTLGLPKGLEIPDGTYTIVVRVNNVEDSRINVVVLTSIQRKIKELSEFMPNDDVATDEYVRSNEMTDDMLNYYYACSLYVNLINMTASLFDNDKVNALILKLNRVMSIINTDNFKI